jgi:hypothetical protein
MELTNWKARRAGGRITVTGTGRDGQPTKIVGVDLIEPSPGGGCLAHGKDGIVHDLLNPLPRTRGSIPQSHRAEGRNFVD